MARSVKIKWATSHYRYGTDDGVRVRFDVVCSSNMPSKIFAYRALPKNHLGAVEGHFSHICSPVDLEEYPEDAPVANFSPEWFRLSYVDVLLRSVHEADEFIALVRSDIQRIVNTLQKMDTLFTGGQELLGDEDCVSTSSSSSSSSSAGSLSSEYGSLNSLSAVGTAEIGVGVGVSWDTIGIGAGSPIGSSDSAAFNRSRVTLCPGEASQLLLVQGFDFAELSDTCLIEGITSRVIIRDATSGLDPSSSVSVSSSESGAVAQCPRINFLALQHATYGLGTNRGDFSCIGGAPAWQTITHGGSSDLWGFPALYGTDLKEGAFGLGIVIANNLDTPLSITEIDGVELVVYFREEA